MFAFVIYRRRAKAVRTGFAFFVAGTAVLGGGCANTGTRYAASPTPAAYVAQGPSVPTESDGLPAQAPPPSTIRRLPDDPTQPYSPNYGGANPASTIPSQPTVKASNDVAPVRASIPGDLPPIFRRQLAAAVDAAG
jgi:hypothetical protein